ncbi:MAG: type II secretion system protein [Desulfobacterales bacterium]|nr:type II secretion system GspH family protein [Deltaproteobacteria bacterium]NNL76168.1 type II secretion system protein [Desulfobacterales bacterium]
MIEGKKRFCTNLKSSRGFTVLELVFVFATICVMSTIAVKGYMDSRMHVVNASALAEARGLGKSVISVFLDGRDVDLAHLPGDGPKVGAVDTNGNPRPAIFTLSGGMQALIIGNSPPGGKGTCTATVWHPRGSGKTFTVIIDEVADVTSFPDY